MSPLGTHSCESPTPGTRLPSPCRDAEPWLEGAPGPPGSLTMLPGLHRFSDSSLAPLNQKDTPSSLVPWLLLCCRSLGGALPPPAGDPAQGLPQVWGCPIWDLGPGTWDLGLDISLSSGVDRRLILNMQKARVVWFGSFSETHNRWIFMDKFFGV